VYLKGMKVAKALPVPSFSPGCILPIIALLLFGAIAAVLLTASGRNLLERVVPPASAGLPTPAAPIAAAPQSAPQPTPQPPPAANPAAAEKKAEPAPPPAAAAPVPVVIPNVNPIIVDAVGDQVINPAGDIARDVSQPVAAGNTAAAPAPLGAAYKGECGKVVEYVVQAGENLFRISYNHGASTWAVARRNGISNIRLIRPNQRLSILTCEQ
jgi:hypothetical protein